MNLPEPVATQPSLEQFRGGTARISGSLVPELVFDLDGSDGIFFEHHTLLWKDASPEHRAEEAARRHQAQDRRARLLPDA